MQALFTIYLTFFYTLSLYPGTEKIFSLPMYEGNLKTNVGIYAPSGEVKADILYFHGYGDSFQNHIPLFNQWNEAGFRIIAFDLPSHGGTTGGEWQDLDWYSFKDLADIASSIERHTVEDRSRPLFLSGWSTGGLLAVRITQKYASLFTRNFSGQILYAPGVSVRKCVGNFACHITNETLTHNQDLLNRSIRPASPLYRVNFAIKLLHNATESWYDPLPSDTPTLVFVAGDEDYYVKSNELLKWAVKQEKEFGADIAVIQFPKARHELDNEPLGYGGPQVREISVKFVQNVLSQNFNITRFKVDTCFDSWL